MKLLRISKYGDGEAKKCNNKLCSKKYQTVVLLIVKTDHNHAEQHSK